jgi:hypothetical protein
MCRIRRVRLCRDEVSDLYLAICAALIFLLEDVANGARLHHARAAICRSRESKDA